VVTITIEYEGDLHCRAVHGPSGTVLKTDAPADNHGKAESFSPTDLVATALGSCILSVMGIKAAAMELDISGATATIDKEMVNVPSRMIHKLAVHIHVPHKFGDRDVKILEAAAYSCPVHKALHGVEMPIRFSWG
jgi:putative redox protein